MAITCGRFYFRRNGVELKDHPLNGSVIAGCGAAVDPVAFDKPQATSWDRRRTEIYVLRGGKERTVTVEDFGGEPVEVYEWWPNPEVRCRFMLVPAGDRTNR